MFIKVLIVLFLALPGLAVADEPVIWAALADRAGVYVDAAAVFSSELAQDAQHPDVQTAPWQELTVQNRRAPQMIVTFGAAAFRGVVERMKREPALAPVPVFAVLLPQASYEALAPRAPYVTSAAYLDQPVDRYLELLHLAMPERRRVGVLFGPDSIALKAALGKAAAARGMVLVQSPIVTDQGDLYPALRSVLDEADVLLALPDSRVFNAASLHNILITAYRQRMPMVAFSESYVKAGAALALYTSPAQAASQAVAAVRGFLSGRGLPPPRASSGFSVATNAEVTRSLGISLHDAERLSSTLRRKEEGR